MALRPVPRGPAGSSRCGLAHDRLGRTSVATPSRSTGKPERGPACGDRRGLQHPSERLKVFGTARVVRTEDDPAFVSSLTVADAYDAVVEAAITVTVTAFDCNVDSTSPDA